MNFNISNITKGVIAGFIATLVLTALMMMKKMMGVMPELDPIHMMSVMAAQKMGMETNMMVGWVMHFMIGAVAWGGAFAVLNNILPTQNQMIKGIILGIGAWLIMMVGPMVMAGNGLFGLALGPMAPVMTFMLHIVFGVVLGLVYQKLTHSTPSV
ncbi:DUF6789 family protein [Colwellia sp. Arc7-D]|uniref:DUF6789 family protein n=1 Tax=Colwellia sp. Arc7-D TaxID=2161872 RepID=UPI000D3689B1|nr:DUF6789 family protein [Colwellia sp. Arc7-D]AWB57415.1 hypothetical protein DBO93_07555 [Colwellia sp. Arc7-D]